jgi:cysteine-S-conjugate beta-lyase
MLKVDSINMTSALFDQIISRRNTYSIAWSRFGPDILPLWVADMDFRAPQEIIDAIKVRAHHGVFGYGDGYPSPCVPG